MESLITTTQAPIVGAEATQPVQQAAAPQAPTQTDKAIRFKNRAETQASKVMTEIEKLQKLANRKYYTYTPEQVNELFGAIQTALDEAKASFTSDSPEKKKLFTFSAWSVSVITKHIRQSNLPDAKNITKKGDTKDAEP